MRCNGLASSASERMHITHVSVGSGETEGSGVSVSSSVVPSPRSSGRAARLGCVRGAWGPKGVALWVSVRLGSGESVWAAVVGRGATGGAIAPPFVGGLRAGQRAAS